MQYDYAYKLRQKYLKKWRCLKIQKHKKATFKVAFVFGMLLLVI